MINLMIPNSDSMKFLWEKFDEWRDRFSDELPTNQIDFACWIAADQNISFIVGPDAQTPVGLFLFQNVTPGASAFCHVFVWDKESMPFKDLVAHAREACSAVMLSHNLQRLNGMTPVTAVPARVFAEKVGFKVEGRVRKASLVDGIWEDAWISGMTREDAGLAELDATMAMRKTPKEE